MLQQLALTQQQCLQAPQAQVVEVVVDVAQVEQPQLEMAG